MRYFLAPAITAFSMFDLCGGGQTFAQTGGSPASSNFSSLSRADCADAVDKTDPNESHYLLCPGVDGYKLQVRKVGSGRLSITVVDRSGAEFPLDFQNVVTRAMTNLDDKAEWRVGADGAPFALIVRVMAHENANLPEQVTSTYVAVARIGADKVCVTSRLHEGSKATVLSNNQIATAAMLPCASILPHSHKF